MCPYLAQWQKSAQPSEKADKCRQSRPGNKAFGKTQGDWQIPSIFHLKDIGIPVRLGRSPVTRLSSVCKRDGSPLPHGLWYQRVL